MELTYDWRSFQTMFYPHRRTASSQGAAAGPVFVVVEGDTIVSVLSDQEDLSDWVGASFHEISARAGHRELISFDRETVDQWISEAAALPHYYAQVEHLRARALASPGGRQLKISRHFLIQSLDGWWSKVLPSCFGVFVRVEGQPEQDLMLLVRRGSFDGFHKPDLSSLSVDRRRNNADIVKYLSEKYLVPVQGLFVTAADWQAWSQDPNPWRQVARAISANRAKMVPFRWGITFLMSFRAFFGI